MTGVTVNLPFFGLLNREWNSSTKKVSISQCTRADSGADSRVDSRAISQAIFLAMRIRPQNVLQIVKQTGGMPDPCSVESGVPKRQHWYLGYFPAGEVDDDDGGRAHRNSVAVDVRARPRIGLKRERGHRIGVFNPISFVLHFFLVRRSIRRERSRLWEGSCSWCE